MDSRHRGVLLIAALLLVAPPAWAQTTGRITGTVRDPQGAVLPGANVTATSPALQGGSQTQVTDVDGTFRFLSLPVGRYIVKAELSGFRTFEQPDVQVGLDRSVELIMTLQVAGVQEVVTVTSVSPTVDVTSTTIGVNATADLFERLPVRRDIYAIARIAPGATEDAVGPAVLGSTGAENQYIIEGLNSTGIERGETTKRLNFDFIEEIEIKTGGLTAEYGRMTGGIINVITKSGGNTFSGSVFGFSEGGALQADDATEPDRPATTTTVGELDNRWDVGVQLGGFIVKDRLWYFGAYNRAKDRTLTRVIRDLNAPGAPGRGSEIFADVTRDLFSGKLTYKLNSGQTLTASFSGDPSQRDGNVQTVAGPEATWRGIRDTGSVDPVGRYDGVFGSRFQLRGIVGRHAEKEEISGIGKNIAGVIDQTVTPNIRTGGFSGYFQDSDFTRDVFKVDATTFLGAHEVKAGADYERQRSSIDRYNGGAGFRISKLFSSTLGLTYYRHRFYVDDRAPGYVDGDFSTFRAAVPLTTEPPTDNTSFYVQDSWRVTPNFTVNAGLRWERQEIGDRDNTTLIDLTENWAPRVGAIWDFARNGRSKLFFNYGRFFESIPMDINIRAFGGEVICFCNNLDPTPENIRPDPAAPRSSALGGHGTPVDPDLKGQYSDEWIVGGEYEVARNLSIGAKYVRRSLGRVIEDFLIISEGEYFIANPGVGLGREMTFYDYSTVPAPQVRRISDTVEFSGRKRFSQGWQFVASYVWQKMEGNYDGLFQNSTGQLDPNINSAFDYADFLVNSEGRLTNDRTHQVKFDGSYELQRGAPGLNLGLSTYWFSGTPLNAMGYSFLYANWEYFLAPRGTLGRGPSEWEASFQASYPIRFRNTGRINLLVDVFNLFNRQAIIELDDRYNLAENGECAGIPVAACNHDNGWVTQPGTLTPVGSLSNARATAPNPDFLRKGVSFTQPRSIRLGVRIQW